MKDIQEIYRQLCAEQGLFCPYVRSVVSYDDTTLFCPAGMQAFKDEYLDESYVGTMANIQRCLRLVDLDEVGDGHHSLVFDMIGLFSFRDWSVEKTIAFFYEFLDRCGLTPIYVSVHPDRKEWAAFHRDGVEVKQDLECIWSLGAVSGYCTEFYVQRPSDGAIIEVGNIVNPLGNCIDVGFGLDRISELANNNPPVRDDVAAILAAVDAMEQSGVKPSNTKQGYAMRKLLRRVFRLLEERDDIADLNQLAREERIKWEATVDKYHKLLPKNKTKSAEWWWDTHGIKIGVDV